MTFGGIKRAFGKSKNTWVVSLITGQKLIKRNSDKISRAVWAMASRSPSLRMCLFRARDERSTTDLGGTEGPGVGADRAAPSRVRSPEFCKHDYLRGVVQSSPMAGSGQ